MIGRDFLAFALRCLQGFEEAGPEEADRRSAVSRAYYGAFHEARALLRRCGISLPKTEQVHVKLGYCLRDCSDPNAAKAGRQLDTLRAQRKVADYDLDDRRFASIHAAQTEVARAHRIVETLDLCRSAPTDDFRAKIRSHARLLGLVVSD